MYKHKYVVGQKIQLTVDGWDLFSTKNNKGIIVELTKDDTTPTYTVWFGDILAKHVMQDEFEAKE